MLAGQRHWKRRGSASSLSRTRGGSLRRPATSRSYDSLQTYPALTRLTRLGMHSAGPSRFFTRPPEIPGPVLSGQFLAFSICVHGFSPIGSLKGRNRRPHRIARAYGREMAAGLYHRRTLRMSLAKRHRQKYQRLRTSDIRDIFYRNTSSSSEPKSCTLASCTYHVVGLPEVCLALQLLSIRKTGTGPLRATIGMPYSFRHMSKSNSSGASAALWSPRKQLSAGRIFGLSSGCTQGYDRYGVEWSGTYYRNSEY